MMGCEVIRDTKYYGIKGGSGNRKCDMFITMMGCP
jgi:hypothetical protein